MNMEKERIAFEAYYITNHHDGDINPNQQLLEWSEKGEFYFASIVNDLWDMWHASANREGYKLVPVETLRQTLEWMNCVEHEFSGSDLSEDVKHADIIKAMIGAVE